MRAVGFGDGNVRSVFNVVKLISGSMLISNKNEDINNSTHLILSDVGVFGPAIKKIEESSRSLCLRIIFLNAKLFLGICEDVCCVVLFEKAVSSQG